MPKSARPGTLIRSQQTYDYALSADVVTYRILYYSRVANGDPVAVSGVVIVPEKSAPAGGWPVIAWAHGFEGVARQCAPSLRDNLIEGPLLSMYINLGYAVVVSDYAGLGTASRNAYVDMQSNAADVIYSVPAARAADPELSPRWIAMGINEGGLVSASVSEVEHDIGDSNYLGSVALSGIVDGPNLLDMRNQSAQLPVFLAYGIKTIFPQFESSEILTDKALPAYREAEASCTLAQAADLPANEALKPDWAQNQFVKKFAERNTLGHKPALRGLLVLASETDPRVPMSLTTQAVDRLCKQGDRVQFFRYPNPDPRALIGDSVRDQIDWIRARFANQQAPSNCH
ncbi:MAG TPA: hypothetical protein VE994_21295 [Terriglobales bacterium]|nr:hypothetical protein [Terriglobales bacterium]